jgi:hypothetical protein
LYHILWLLERLRRREKGLVMIDFPMILGHVEIGRGAGQKSACLH